MKIKWGIDCGHNCPPKDIGAVGIRRECEMTKEVGSRVMALLVESGFPVVDCTPRSCLSVSDSLRKRALTANQSNVDYFVSIHFNAHSDPDARGSEVFAVSSRGKALAKSVLDKIVKLGFKNRGVKNQNFQVLRETKMPAILVECCFLTNREDMNLFDSEKMAEAIVDGLLDGAINEIIPPSSRIDP